MISQRDLASLRSSVQDAFTTTCTITHRVVTNSGSEQAITSTTDSDVPCQVLALGSNTTDEQDIAAGVQGRQLVPILLPYNQSVSENDLIAVNGVSYEVVRLDHRSTKVTQRVLCVKSE